MAYEFDRESGRHSRRLVRLGIPLPVCGFGAIERTREHGKVFFCIYRWDSGLIFQAGKRAWRLDRADLKFSYRVLGGGTSSEFSILEGSDVAYRCSYRHWFRGLLSRRNVTDDTVDLERDHFLAHLAARTLPARDFEGWEDGNAPEPAPED